MSEPDRTIPLGGDDDTGIPTSTNEVSATGGEDGDVVAVDPPTSSSSMGVETAAAVASGSVAETRTDALPSEQGDTPPTLHEELLMSKEIQDSPVPGAPITVPPANFSGQTMQAEREGTGESAASKQSGGSSQSSTMMEQSESMAEAVAIAIPASSGTDALVYRMDGNPPTAGMAAPMANADTAASTETQTDKTRNWRKIGIIAGIVLIVVIIAIAVPVAVTSNKNNAGSSSPVVGAEGPPAPTGSPTIPPTAAPTPFVYVPIENDECGDATKIVPRTDTNTLLVARTFNATTAGTQFSRSPAVYYRFVGANRRVRISTCTPETNYDSAIYVNKWTSTWVCSSSGGFYGSPEFSSQEDLECDPTTKAATVEFFAVGGVQYFIAVAGRTATDSGRFGLSFYQYENVENDECQTAKLVFPTSDRSDYIVDSTATAAQAKPGLFNDDFNDSPVVYYRFQGTDKRVRISTCAPQTDFQTSIYVLEAQDNYACPDIGGLYRITYTAFQDFECDPSGNAASVEFFAKGGVNYRFALSGRRSIDSGTYGLNVFEYTEVANDECKYAERIFPTTNETDFVSGSTSNAAQSKPQMFDDQFNDSPVVYYRFTGTNRRVRISTCSDQTDFNSAIYVLKGQDSNACPITGGLYQITFDSFVDWNCDPSGRASTVEFYAVRGTTYRIAVAGRAAEEKGNFGLLLFEYTQIQNDECQNALPVTPSSDRSALVVGNTKNAQPARPQLFDEEFNDAPVVYYEFFARSGYSYRISTCTNETNYDTAIYVLRSSSSDSYACPDSGGFVALSYVSLEDLDCDSTAKAATISFRENSGIKTRIAVTGRTENDSGRYGLSVQEYQ